MNKDEFKAQLCARLDVISAGLDDLLNFLFSSFDCGPDGRGSAGSFQHVSVSQRTCYLRIIKGGKD